LILEVDAGGAPANVFGASTLEAGTKVKARVVNNAMREALFMYNLRHES
jgi:hypothetical protein